MTDRTEDVPAPSPRDGAVPVGPANPWARWGWLMGAGWIVFLVFPITAALEAEHGTAVRVLALAGIAAFATVFVAGFVRMMRGRRPAPSPLTALALLIALVAAESFAIGSEALGMSPFVVSFAMFAFTWPRAPVAAGGVMVAALVALVLGGDDDLWFFGILLPVTFGFTLLVRSLEHYGERHDRIARQMAIVSERERVARDVHDVLGHSLTAITVKAELAERMIDIDPDRARSELAQVRTLTREALAEIRSTVAGLRVTLVDGELEVARDALRSAGIHAHLPDDVEEVDPMHRIVLGWALREAVTNVVRHSRARTCTVELGSASLVVTDDGVGAGGTGGPEGNGLRGLRERVGLSGGTLLVATGPDGRGTRLEVTL